jgi:hypothetical protein
MRLAFIAVYFGFYENYNPNQVNISGANKYNELSGRCQVNDLKMKKVG